MNVKLAGLAIALGLVGAALPAAAADWTGPGSYKDYGAGIPVPAPIPVPVYAPEWYLRLDVGVGFANAPSVSASGEPFGIPSSTEEPFGFSPAWFNKDFTTFFTGGAGVGYRWSPYFRTDITADYHSSGDVQISGTQIYEVVTGGVPSGNFSEVVVSDKTTFNSGVFLLNGYIDFASWRSVTPYIGAGVGFAVNSLRRVHNSADFTCGADPTCASPGGEIDSHADDRTDDVSFAAAFMAGITYEITPTTSLDFNYRFLHIGGSDIPLTVNGVPTKVSIGDINDHQLRAGLRFNIF